MKRHHVLGGALLLVLSGLVAACTGDLLDSRSENYANPYLNESRALVANLVDSAVGYTASNDQRGPTLHDHGELLLEALASAPGVDIDVPGMNALLSSREAAAKGAPDDPFPGETRLSSSQKRHLDRVLQKAGSAVDLGDLGRILAKADRAIIADLGDQAAKPILAVTAGLFAQYEYFTDPAHAPTLRRLIRQVRDYPAIQRVSYESTSRFRILRAQDSGDNRGGDPPPFWGQFFNPGEWWSETVSDTREAAELGVLGGAGIGCLVGSLPTIGAGCAIGGGAGGLIGGLVGILVGGISAGVANYEESSHDFEVAETEWCQSQAGIRQTLRHTDFAARCDASHN